MMVDVAFAVTKTTYHIEDGRTTEDERKSIVADLLHFAKDYNYTFAFKSESDGNPVGVDVH